MVHSISSAVLALGLAMSWGSSEAQVGVSISATNELRSVVTLPDEAADALPPDSVTKGAVSLVNGKTLAYTATAGILMVGSSDARDAKLALNGTYMHSAKAGFPTVPDDTATARMFYTAYFLTDADKTKRPIIFIYDGGPGASTRTMIMESFAPVLVRFPDLQHPVGAISHRKQSRLPA